MRKKIALLLFCSIVLMLTACAKKKDEAQPKSDTQKQTQEIQDEEPEIHSDLYDERYSVEDVITYFKEVVLDVEYSDGTGDSTVVQKWVVPLRYEITGEATQRDLEVLEEFCNELNQIEGFPGISKASEDSVGNVFLGFYGYDDFHATMDEVINYEEADGAVQFWYGTDTNDIYEMTIGYRTDVEQQVRNSVLIEEIINGIGVTDTKLREDSIVYQGYSEIQELSDVDWLILKLLYHPEIQCGMQAAECESVIRKIYY